VIIIVVLHCIVSILVFVPVIIMVLVIIGIIDIIVIDDDVFLATWYPVQWYLVRAGDVLLPTSTWYCGHCSDTTLHATTNWYLVPGTRYLYWIQIIYFCSLYFAV